MSTSTDPRSLICQAIDRAITETGLTSREVADRTGFAEYTIAKWRNGTNTPDRDAVAHLERSVLKDKPLGYISRLAGYVEDTSADDLLVILDKTPRLTEAYRKVLLRMVAEGLQQSEAEMAEDRSIKRKIRAVRP